MTGGVVVLPAVASACPHARRREATGLPALGGRSAGRRDRHFDERGLTTLEAVLVAPAVLIAIFSCLQFALWYYAGSVVRAAATEGADAGALTNAGPPAATAKAYQVLDAAAGGLIRQPAVQATTTGRTVRVTVRGNAPSLILGLNLGVSATADEPVESFDPGTRP